MARIYRDTPSHQVVIEGASSRNSSLYEWSNDSGKIKIWNKVTQRYDFDADWSKVLDFSGNSLTSLALTLGYLTEVFYDQNMVENEELSSIEQRIISLENENNWNMNQW